MASLKYFVIGLLVFFLLGFRLNQPFWGNHEFNGVYYGQIARNYNRYGLIETRGGQVNNLYPTPKSEWNFHVNHPATYPLILFEVLKLLGEGEASLRLVSVVASGLGMVFLAKLVVEFYGSKDVWVAVLPIMLTPLFLYYGAVPVFEPLLFPIVTYGFWNYWRNKKSDNYWRTVLACFLAMMVDWPGFWLPTWLIVIEVLTYRRWGLVKQLMLGVIVATSLILAHQKILTGSFLNDLLNVGGFRLGVGIQPFTNLEWVRLMLVRARAFWGLPVLIVSIVGLLNVLVQGLKEKKIFVLGILGMGVSHMLVFRSIAWYHDYMLYHTIIVVGLLIGGVMVSLRKIFGISVLMAGTLGLSVLTVAETSKFYVALVNQRPFKKCVEIGKQVAESEEVLSFEVTSEEAKTCPAFVGFYGDRPFELLTVD